MKSIEEIAVELLRHCVAHDIRMPLPILGTLTAVDLARLAVSQIDTCPKCGSVAWVNIDCELCDVGAAIEGASDA